MVRFMSRCSVNRDPTSHEWVGCTNLKRMSLWNGWLMHANIRNLDSCSSVLFLSFMGTIPKSIVGPQYFYP